MKQKIFVIIIMTLLLMTTVNFVPKSLKAEETDSLSPEITSTSSEPEAIGFGFNVTFTPSVFDNQSGVNLVKINITYPDNTYVNYTMNNTSGNIYEYLFNNTWQVGQYNYTIWSIDNANNSNITSQHSFNVSAQANILVCTLKDEYGPNETINLTDPPSSSYLVGYELLDDGDVLHIWNNLDHYYFDTDSGIQLTNHYNEYWSHNVLMLGYYNNDEWNLINRTDELSGFNKNIESDNETYVNATLWKDLNYAGYDFRLAIRHHLAINDNELTVIPYIKNIDDEDIPYNLGFAWEIKDIQIDMTEENDYIEIDGETYYLNISDLDETYTNMNNPSFYIKEDKTNTKSESLYLRWDENLNYKVQVKSITGQYNAPVTLGIKIGTLNVGQEKSTEMYWYDAIKSTYHFNSYNTMLAWSTNPAYMVDGNTSNYASTMTDRDLESCNGNTCTGTDLGTISKVEIRCFGKYSGNSMPPIHDIILNTLGGMHVFSPSTTGAWSSWYDITNNPNAPSPWLWTDVENLIVDVDTSIGGLFTMYCSKIEVQVTYNTNPVYSYNYPLSGSTGISITPTLNITVNDQDGDIMNITWLSNSSGSWQIFGTNNSVTNGTYHQIFSNATVNGQWWYWKVNVSDGTNTVTSDVFSFYTGSETKIVNTGTTNISGYLTMQVQYYCDLIEDWIIVNETINEDTSRTVNAGEHLALDTIFNGLINSSVLRYGNGTYRIYAAFMDPNDNVLKCNDDSFIKKGYEFEFNSPPLVWQWSSLGGFGSSNNNAIRGIEIFNDELYVGTENYNKKKFLDNIQDNSEYNGFLAGTSIKMADESYKDIEDIEIGDQVKTFDVDNNSYVTANVTDIYCFSVDVVPDYYIVINNKLYISPYHQLYINGTLTNTSDLEKGDYLVDVNGSNVTVNSSVEVFTKKKLFNLMVSVNPGINDIQDNLTYFAEDLQVYPLGSNGEWSPGFFIGTFFKWFFNLFGNLPIAVLAKTSDGGEIWKYNHNTKEWTEIVGRSGEGYESSGFGDYHNWAISAMKVFNGNLYVGTWQSTLFGGEIWRYDGSTWEPIVGRDAVEEGGFYGGGFNNKYQQICSMEVFENSNGETHLYVGTMDFTLPKSDSGCQIWRTTSGDTDEEDWEKVVDKGFNNHGADSNVYITAAWCMREFYDHLYIGTLVDPGGKDGCQLWRTETGGAITGNWEKVDLLNDDGFGEKVNYGIRRMSNFSDDLYCSIVANGNVVDRCWTDEIEALEIWKYDGNEDWECIVGDDVVGAEENDYEYDGFGDHYNKYCWSMTVCDDELWMGTLNHQKLSIFKSVSKGLEVWRYDGENLYPSVKNVIGKIGNGFGSIYSGNMDNLGARAMIEYPTGSGKLVVGTYTMSLSSSSEDNSGCEVWIRYPD